MIISVRKSFNRRFLAATSERFAASLAGAHAVLSLLTIPDWLESGRLGTSYRIRTDDLRRERALS